MMIDHDHPLILASASPRRKALLAQVGLPFRSHGSGVLEAKVEGNPEKITCRLAEQKAQAVAGRFENAWILGTDTVVVAADEHLQGRRTFLGKPSDTKDAMCMLHRLSGKRHHVVTGFCILDPWGQSIHQQAVTTHVDIKELTEQEILAYAATKEPLDKAGSYAIQGIGAFMVTGISGSYTNVVGLPLHALIKALVAHGALKRFP